MGPHTMIKFGVLLGVFVLNAATSSQAVEYRFYHPDPLGSNVVVTNRTGEVVQRTVYTPYGEPRSIVNSSGQSIEPSADAVRHLFTGQEHDPESGLHYLSARYYDPFVGKFLSVDPELRNLGITFSAIQTAPGNLNAHSYALNRPTVLIDPTGRFPQQGSNEAPPSSSQQQEVPVIRQNTRDLVKSLMQAITESKQLRFNSKLFVTGDPQPVEEMLQDIERLQDGVELVQNAEQNPDGRTVVVVDDANSVPITYVFDLPTGETIAVVVISSKMGMVLPDGSIFNSADQLAHELGHARDREDMEMLSSTPSGPYRIAGEYSPMEFVDAPRAMSLGNTIRPMDRRKLPRISMPCPTCR